MKLKVFSVFDSKAQCYMLPFFLHSSSVAVRAFKDAALDPTHPISKNKGDYTLFMIGEYDDQTAFVDVGKHYVNLGTALQLASSTDNLEVSAHEQQS